MPQPLNVGETADLLGLYPAELRAGRLWLCAYAAALVYGSLLPFDFTVARLVQGRPIPDPVGCLPSLQDALVNLLVYFPLGVLAALSSKPLRIGALRPRRLLAWVLAAGGLSLACEMAQLLIASRVSSWTDVLLNMVGACAGSCLGVWLRRRGPGWLGDGLRRFRRQPFHGSLVVLTAGLFAIELAPLDLVTSAQALHAGFARAQLDFRLSAAALSLDEWTATAWFAVLGALAAVASLERGRSTGQAMCWAVRHGLITLVLIETLQLFTGSHIFEAHSIVLRSVGVCVGAWLGLFILELKPASVLRLTQPKATALAAMIAVQIAFMLSCSVDSIGSVRGNSATWLPFEAVWRLPLSTAALTVSGTMLTYAVLSALVCCWAVRIGLTNFAAPTVLVALFVAALAEGLRSLSTAHSADFTVAVLAVVAAVVVSSLYRVLTHLHAADAQLCSSPVSG